MSHHFLQDLARTLGKTIREVGCDSLAILNLTINRLSNKKEALL